MQHLHQYPWSHFLEEFKDVFTFLAASTHWWGVLKSNCSVPVKQAVDTRWSARKEAVSCLKKVFSRLVDTLEIWQIRKKHETREEAGLLLSALQTFSFLFFPLYMWEPILSEVVITQKYLLQKRSGPYSVCVKDSEFGWLFAETKRITGCRRSGQSNRHLWRDENHHWTKNSQKKKNAWWRSWWCWFHIRARASQRNARLFGFSISRDSPGFSKN